ncbi:MAG: isoleucine--tRNA ligase [archaeon]
MSNYDHKKIEEEILSFWKDKKVFDKLMKRNKGKKPWSFIDGPITANNPMGVHHAWGRTYKDVYQRFKAMQGYDQRFQNGFDCQGLWLEVETEKELNFNSRKDIEDYGLDNFSKACRKRVEKFSKIQTEQSIRLGQWMDWENSYYTMSDENIQAIWHFLKKCHEKRWLYKGTKVLPWCIRCGTSSSQHEMSDEGYAELTHPSVYVKAKIKNRNKEYLLIWTTTEWTLSSNVAAAVNPELNYSQVKKDGETYYLSESSLNKLEGNYIVLDTIKGKDLVGLEYESFYPEIEVQKNIKHKVVAWDEVGETEGTGIVHIAPTCGEEDYELGKKEKLPLIKPALNEEGVYFDGFGWLSKKRINKKLKEEIINDLDKRGILYKIENYTHRYPICWRCKEELVFRMSSEWFIKADEIRPLMKKEAQKVKWEPEHVGKLMQNWLDNMSDWNIGRKRYWGLPLMFYECKCNHLNIIGSLKELKEKAINKKLVDSLPGLHRPWIDEIKIKCEKCNQEVSRIKEVGDCWLDAGIVPFSTLKYFSDKTYWKKWFPAELVIEMRAQVRLWFYSTLFMSVTLENKAPYRQVFAYEEVRDENDESMHKSKGNAIWFDEAVEKMGADVMRWIYCNQDPKFNLRFGYNAAKEANRQLNVVWNLGNYVRDYSEINKTESQDIASKWIISIRESTKKLVVEYLEKLQPDKAIEHIKTYLLDDLSRNYVRLIRDDLEDKKVQATLLNSFLDGLRLLAPFTPFITEQIYQNLKKPLKLKEESIHLEKWPKHDQKLINKKLEKDMESAKLIIQNILAEREKVKINVRWPLADVTITTEKNIKQILSIIQRQTNIKKIILKKGKDEIKLNTVLTKELEKEGFTRELMRRIQDLRKKANLKKEDKIKLNINSSIDLDYETIKKTTNASLEKIKGQYSDKFVIKEKDFEISFDVIK